MTIRETRRRRFLAACALVFSASACGPGRVTMPGAISDPADGGEVRLRVRVAGSVMSVPLEQYVLGAALSEVTPVGVPPTTAGRIYDVQAVIARTYALSRRGRHAAEGFDLCDDTHCQLYQPDRVGTSSFSAVARAAVDRTRGLVLRLDSPSRPVIEALFHADCGGATTTPAVAWGGTNHSYLPSRDDVVEGLTHRTWTFQATREEWRRLLNADSRTAVGAQLTGVTVTSTGPGGRVTAISLQGTRTRVVSGEVLRNVVTAIRGSQSILSSRFTIEATNGGFVLRGSGFGHGVGLCQRGAQARAVRGDSLAAILDHYYPGARLAR